MPWYLAANCCKLLFSAFDLQLPQPQPLLQMLEKFDFDRGTLSWDYITTGDNNLAKIDHEYYLKKTSSEQAYFFWRSER